MVQVPDRDRVREHLTAHGIGTEIYYPVPFHRQACFAALGHSLEAFPCADAAAARVLALPIFAELTDDQLQRVVAAIADAVR